MSHNIATRREDFGTMLAYLVEEFSSGVTYYYVPWRSMSSFFFGGLHATFSYLNYIASLN
jgi:hypothetical protein